MKIQIGKIINTIGLRGELKLYPQTDLIEEILATKTQQYYFKQGDQVIFKNFKISKWRRYKTVYAFYIQTLNHINEVEKYQDCELWCDTTIEITKSDDEYLVSELLSYTPVDPKGNVLGQIVEIFNSGATEIFRIKTPSQEVLIPFVRTIITVDTSKEQIIIKNFEDYII